MFFDYSILNELKRVPTDAPEDEKDKYNLDEEEPGEEPTNYDLEVDEEDDPEDTEDGYDLDEESEGEPEEEPTEDEVIDEEEPVDDEEGYDLDDDMGEEEPEGEPTDDEEVEGPEGNSNSTNELRDLENKIFDIGPIGLDIKERTLKQDYLKLYNNINTILDKIRLVPKTSVNISVIEFCNKKLYELKTICYDYLLYTYSDKTYIENQKNYITYLSIIVNINNLLMQIQPKME